MTARHELESTSEEQLDSCTAFSEFARSMAEPLYQYFARRVSTSEDAADAVADCMVVLWEKRESLPASLEERRAWMFVVARNVLWNSRRSNGRREALHLKLRGIARNNFDAPQTEMDPHLAEVLRTMNHNDRDLVLLVACEGFSVAECGLIFEISAQTARKRYSRLRKKMRRELSRRAIT